MNCINLFCSEVGAKVYISLQHLSTHRQVYHYFVDHYFIVCNITTKSFHRNVTVLSKLNKLLLFSGVCY